MHAQVWKMAHTEAEAHPGTLPATSAARPNTKRYDLSPKPYARALEPHMGVVGLDGSNCKFDEQPILELGSCAPPPTTCAGFVDAIVIF